MDPAAIITGVASMAMGLFNYLSQQKTNETAMSFSEQSAAKQQDYSKDLLDYNSPSYQMQRLTQAGLNPNLVYDNLDSSVPTGAHADTPSLKAPQMTDPSVVMDNALKAAQINRLDAAATNETSLTDAEVKSLYKGLDLKDAEIQSLHSQVDLMSKQMQELDSKIANLDETTRGKVLDNSFKSRTLDGAILNLQKEWKITSAQAYYSYRFAAASCLRLERESELILSQLELNKAQKGVLSELSGVYRDTSAGIRQENELRGFSLSAARSSLYTEEFGSIPYGVVSAKTNILSDYYKMRFVNKQRYLLETYGGAEHVFGLVESASRIFMNSSDAISNFLGTSFSSKISSPAGVRRLESSSHPILGVWR